MLFFPQSASNRCLFQFNEFPASIETAHRKFGLKKRRKTIIPRKSSEAIIYVWRANAMRAKEENRKLKR